MTEEDRPLCGAETNDGTPCKHSASRDDGRCHIHTDIDDGSGSPGRPTKLTHQRQENIAQALEAGVGFKASCEAAGIDPSTGRRWLNIGEEQDEGIFSEFHTRITRARGVGKLDLSESIVQIAKERGDAGTLLRYLQHIEGGELSQEDKDELAGLNLIVPDVAKRPAESEPESETNS